MNRNTQIRNLPDDSRQLLCRTLYVEAQRMLGIEQMGLRSLMLERYGVTAMKFLTLEQYGNLFAHIATRGAERAVAEAKAREGAQTT